MCAYQSTIILSRSARSHTVEQLTVFQVSNVSGPEPLHVIYLVVPYSMKVGTSHILTEWPLYNRITV